MLFIGQTAMVSSESVTVTDAAIILCMWRPAGPLEHSLNGQLNFVHLHDEVSFLSDVQG